MWSFETDDDFQALLDWADGFVTDEIEPVDLLIEHAWDVHDPLRNTLIRPLQDEVRAKGLWATHLGPDLGGPGYGQLKLALLNEILGRSHSAPIVFGCGAPDTGNAEILAHYGTDQQKKEWLTPLIDGDIVSAFSMTEPQGGSDPTGFTCRATEVDGGWLLDGQKWFSSNARFAEFLIVLAVTDPDAEPHRRLSAFVLPTDLPGIEIVRDVGVAGHDFAGVHAYVNYDQVRLPEDALLGERGGGFTVAQTRLGGGRIHHAMRTIGLAKQAFSMMLERAVSRQTKGSRLADKQLVQAMIADSFVQIEQFRLLVLQTAWKIDRYSDYRAVRNDIAAVKIAMPKVLHDVTSRAVQIHGSLGISDEMPFATWLVESYHMGLADGATEVHQLNLAKGLLRDVEVAPDLFPSGHLVRRRAAAREKYASAMAVSD